MGWDAIMVEVIVVEMGMVHLLILLQPRPTIRIPARAVSIFLSTAPRFPGPALASFFPADRKPLVGRDSIGRWAVLY
jgi:hypothetical protein